MHPFFFGPSHSPLFAIYEAPKLASTCGVLICPPLGQEHIRTHRALKLLGKQLTQANFHVLRFDYFGTGDSAGASGEGSLTRWIEDTECAAAELRTLGELRTLSVVGWRFGATLAALAATPSLGVDTLVLWDPVCSGRKYLEELGELQRGVLRDPLRFPEGRETGPDELVGFAYPRLLRQDLAALNLASTPVPTCGEAVLLAEPNDAEATVLSNTYRAAGGKVAWVDLPERGAWGDASQIEEALLVPASVRTITSLLTARHHA